MGGPLVAGSRQFGRTQNEIIKVGIAVEGGSIRVRVSRRRARWSGLGAVTR